jgi:hypothetical protein
MQAPSGFYETSNEKEDGKKQALDPTFEALTVSVCVSSDGQSLLPIQQTVEVQWF